MTIRALVLVLTILGSSGPWAMRAVGQCVVINEVMINPASGCDGSCTPNTAEWTELYNTCNTPVDISCYVIADGDWSATIPQGTILAPNDYYLIGSSGSGVPVDLNIGSCGCTSGTPSNVGVFTNGNEQLALISPAGVFESAVYWGNGQFSNTTFNVAATGGCAGQGVVIASSSGTWQQASTTTTVDGSFIARPCDGADVWVTLQSGATPGASNSTSGPQAAFAANFTSICAGDCVAFTDQSIGAPETWEWEFDGAAITSFSGETPPSICYPNPGVYSVSLTVSNECGSDVLTETTFITVNVAPVPTITTSGPTTICTGGSVVLSTTAQGNLQWLADGNAIPGATSSNFTVSNTGSYTILAVVGNCSNESQPMDVLVLPGLTPSITFNGDAQLCQGEQLNLQAPTGFATYEWTLNGVVVATNVASYTAEAAGDYVVTTSNGACTGSSSPVTVTVSAPPAVQINPSGNQTICPGGSVTLTATAGLASYAWQKDDSPIAVSGNVCIATDAGSYTVVGTNSGGCEATSNEVIVSFFELSVPVIEAAGSTEFCFGGNVVLQITQSFVAYQWLSNASNIPAATSEQFSVNASGTYQVTTTDNNGCEATSNAIAVTANPIPTASINPSGNVVTCTVPFLLTASSSSAVAWSWQKDGVNIPGATAATFSVTEEGSYVVNVTSAAGCSATSAATVVQFETSFEASLEVSNAAPCEGDVILLSFDGNYTTIDWSTGSTAGSIEVSTTGLYSVQAINSAGCVASLDTLIAFSPLPQVFAGDDVETDCSAGVVLNAQSDGTSFLWQPSTTLSNDTLLQPVANPTQSTLYTVVATLDNCTATDQVFVKADCSAVYVPSSFTPNYDGVNDYFQVVARGLSKFEIIIFDRWGDVVYQSNDVNEKWQGGKDTYFVPDGIYSYRMVALDERGIPLLGDEASYGHIVVLR